MTPTEQQQTILIVDDEPTNIQALGNLLKDEYHIRVATSGEKALAMIQDRGQALPDLILLDIQMPGIDGYEVCRRVKADPHTSTSAIIFVTARNTAHEEEFGLNLGAVDYIVKPFTPAIVRARVNTHMKLKQKTDLLERHALLDGLTGVPNRRHFDEQFDVEVKRSLRDGHPLSVIMMDIDHFKAYNDHYGHGAGDQCLQKVAKALATALSRPSDRVYRYGGEEFVALLPGTDMAGTREVAERLRIAIEDLGISHEYSSAGPVVTVSLGTATLEPGGDIKQDSLLKHADLALYAAKEAGRNRIA